MLENSLHDIISRERYLSSIHEKNAGMHVILEDVGSPQAFYLKQLLELTTSIPFLSVNFTATNLHQSSRLAMMNPHTLSTKTFTCFPLLPPELQVKVWDHSLPCRRRFARIGWNSSFEKLPAVYSTCVASHERFLFHYTKMNDNESRGFQNPGFVDFKLDIFDMELISVSTFQRALNIRLGPCTLGDARNIKRVWLESNDWTLRSQILFFFGHVYIANPQISELTIIITSASRCPDSIISTEDQRRWRAGLPEEFADWKFFLTAVEDCQKTWSANGWEWKLPRVYVDDSCYDMTSISVSSFLGQPYRDTTFEAIWERPN